MKVVILAGGLGMRLREETEYKPKPLIVIGDNPILWHIMAHYMRYGYDDFIICLGYRGDQIRSYFLNYDVFHNTISIEIGNGSSGAVNILEPHREHFTVTLVNTGHDTMTGSRVKQIEHLISDDHFFLTYGDTLSDVPLDRLLEFHSMHGKIGTVTGVVPTSRYGMLELEESRVMRFAEKPKLAAEYISGGFFVFRKEFFRYLTTDESLILEKQPLSQLAMDDELRVYKHDGFWCGMDTIRDVNYLNTLWAASTAPWKTT